MAGMRHDNTGDDVAVERGRSGPPWKLILLLVVAAGLAVFFFQNSSDAPIHFLWFDFTWPLWAVIGISVLIGIVLDRLGTWQWRRSRDRRTAE